MSERPKDMTEVIGRLLNSIEDTEKREAVAEFIGKGMLAVRDMVQASEPAIQPPANIPDMRRR